MNKLIKYGTITATVVGAGYLIYRYINTGKSENTDLDDLE